MGRDGQHPFPFHLPSHAKKSRLPLSPSEREQARARRARFISSCSANPRIMARNHNRKMFGGMMGVGTFLAFALSWFEHHSLFWAIVHAVYSWCYIAYYALTKSGAMAPIAATP